MTCSKSFSIAWSAAYPTSSPDTSKLPQDWVDALNAAISSGKVPDIPQSTMSSSGEPVYPDGLDPAGAEVCSATYKCQIDGDVWDAPDGMVGAGFDDGPLPTSTQLYEFLKEQGVHATHFMIGVNIINNPGEFTMAFETNQDDIAVHTWTHPYMTTLSNLQVLGELGWTTQLIHNSTGGRLPRYWRPPYGDSDARVRAIALEVFGLTTIIWNHDTEDWSLTTPGGTNVSAVHASLEAWYAGPKSPGLIILEHELSNLSVQAYIDAFPLIAQNGWAVDSVARLAGQDGGGDEGSAYQNIGADGGVQPVDGVLGLAGGALARNSTTSTVPSSSAGLSPSSSPSPSPSSSSAPLASPSTTARTASVITRSGVTSASAIPSPAGAQQKSGGAHSYGTETMPWKTTGLATALALIVVAAIFP
ncbi:hypothetical protein AcV5_000652 [Taiwanofungus camphoratus]|nr:hypothetical protein AcV5_000652 [Antrodia cinnamomea]KAI0952077.1 hypothetical protein AcV7_007994 [Antrodia cinnamomea]